MTKLLLHESKRRVGSPGVFITPGTYFISILRGPTNLFCLLTVQLKKFIMADFLEAR